ncbi:MAG TPA: c-type cytochrome [Terracidiphilus sp.]|nr:c-type cytochrome [Terracidiphilus sp.]
MKLRIALATWTCLFFCMAMAGCDAGKTRRAVDVSTMGDPQHGRQLIASYGCGACHMIPGVHAARGKVGPPLLFFAERTMIAGELPNTPANLEKWIQHPKQVEPNTAMPDLGVQPQEAREIAAYLYTLRGGEGTSWID